MKRILLVLALFFATSAEAQFTQRVTKCVTPTVTAGAYGANDNIGGKLTFPSVVSGSLSTGIVTAAYVYDKASQSVAYELQLFRSDPAATTFTDNSAIDIADSDLSRALVPISFTTSDRFSFADNSFSARQAQYIPFSLSTATSARTLYGSLRTGGAPTYATTTDLTVCITVEAD